jgi:hypothetical protein
MEKAKSKTARKANERTNVSSSDEDNPHDLHNMVECPVQDTPTRKKRKVTYEVQSSAGTEEQAFKDRIANLGNTDEASDESTVSSEDTEHQRAFDTIKRIMAREVLLTHPNFQKPFHVHADAIVNYS